jgi:hypothetical protein
VQFLRNIQRLLAEGLFVASYKFALVHALADLAVLKGEDTGASLDLDILSAKLPKRVSITAAERRRLIKFGQPLGAALRQLISIVSPRTFFRWLHGDQKKRVPSKLGRPRTAQEVRELVLRLAGRMPGGTPGFSGS